MNKEEIKKYRKDKGLTQESFGKLLGVSKRTIINYEKGEFIPESKVKLLHSIISNNNIVESKTKTKLEIVKGVPYYDVEFTSGFVELVNNQTTTPNSYIQHPFFRDCDCVIRNSGQSMAKIVKHGDAVGLKTINDWNEFLAFGEVYAIVTKNGFNLIKVITKGEKEDTFTLISKPSESKVNEFPPQQIKKNNIRYLYRVLANSHLF